MKPAAATKLDLSRFPRLTHLDLAVDYNISDDIASAVSPITAPNSLHTLVLEMQEVNYCARAALRYIDDFALVKLPSLRRFELRITGDPDDEPFEEDIDTQVLQAKKFLPQLLATGMLPMAYNVQGCMIYLCNWF
jgi:hypothetical protein